MRNFLRAWRQATKDIIALATFGPEVAQIVFFYLVMAALLTILYGGRPW